MEGDELVIRGTGAPTGRVAPGGELWVEEDLVVTEDDVRVRVRLHDEGSQASMGLALVSPTGEWYAARLSEAGPTLDRSSGQWSSMEQGSDNPGFNGWIWLEIELGRDGSQRRWSVRTWPEGGARPAEADIVAFERRADSISVLSPAILSDGRDHGRAADLEIEELTTKGLTVGTDGWPIELIDDRPVFSAPSLEGSQLSLAQLDQKVAMGDIAPAGTTLKTASSFPCNPYEHRFVGSAPSFPGSTAAIGLPAVDHDCDGSYNEDGSNGVDDDGDGLVDEDPGSCDDWLLNWTSEDDRHGSVASGDVTAVILTIRRVWPSFKESMIFGTIFGGPEYALAGAVRITPDPTGFAELIGSNGFVSYLLVEAANEPLTAELLESGAVLIDAQAFDRSVVFNADLNGGTPPVSADATIDGVGYTLGEPYEVDGVHTIRLEVSDGAGELVVVERSFTVDTTPPELSNLQPASGTVLGSTPVVITGLVSADAVEVAVGGVLTALDPPSGGTRAFTSAPTELVEGVNTIDVMATDGTGHMTNAQLGLMLDTQDPVVVIVTPPDGTFTTVQPIGVTGTVIEANLSELVVNGTAVAMTAGQFTVEMALVEGSNTIEAVATDVLGRQGSAIVTVVLDTTAPGVFITEPVSGLVTDGSTVDVAGIFDEPLSAVNVNGLETTFGGGAFSIDGVPLGGEGENFIVATATDLAGNEADSPPVLVIRDTLPPTVAMDTAGMPTLTASPTLTVTGTAVDPHLASVTVAGQAATLIGEQWTVEMSLSEGGNELVAVAEDTLGHTAETAPFIVTLDTVAPAVTITNPVDGTGYISTVVPVEGTVVDPHLDTTSIVVNGTAATVVDETFTVELELPEGDSVLVAQAADTLGQVSTSAPVSITIDTLSPVVTLAEPLQPLVSTLIVDVTGTVADPHLETVTVDGIAAIVVGGQFTASGISLVEGSNLLTATAVDTFGHSATSNEVEYILDTIPPEIAITSPVEGELVLTGTVTVTGTATDDHLGTVVVNGVAATIDGGVFTAENVPVNEGVTVLTAVAEDFLDHTTTATVTVLSDTAAPGVAILSPEPGACVPAGQALSVTGTVFDVNLSDGLGGNPAPVVLEVTTTDGVQQTYQAVLAADGRSWSVDAVDPGSADGTAILSITAHDAAGRTGVAAGSLRVDATPPNLTLLLDGGAFPGAAPGTTPPAGAMPVLLNRTVAARVSVADGAFGAPEATLTLDGMPYVAGTLVETEGDHLLVATATDCAGHTAAVHALFHIDLTRPTLLTTEPADGAQLTSGPATFTGTADSELAVGHDQRRRRRGHWFRLFPLAGRMA